MVGNSNNIKLSIIVPCYNVENYIRKCLSSIVDQTLKEIEIICVNDGSTDNTLNIISEFAGKDERIFVIDKPNSGYGDSLNTAISEASGEYIGIVESDDFAESEMFETLYNKAKEYDADVVKSNFWLYWGTEDRDDFFECLHKDECNKIIDPLLHDNGSFYNRKASVWSAIYRRKYLTDNKIRFLTTPGASFQDISFTFKVLSTTKKMVCVYEPFLHYRQDNASSSINNVERKIPYFLKEYDEVINFINAANYGKEHLFSLYCSQFYDNCLYIYERSDPVSRYPFLKIVSDKFKDILSEIDPEKINFGDCWWKRRDIVRIAEDPYQYHMWRNDERYDQKKGSIRCANPDIPVGTIVYPDGYKDSTRPTFSVIIPIFNVEKFLPSALESLLYQTYKDLEIICINNGSTDNSLSIIKAYSKIDKRIIIINQEHSSLAAARNNGMDISKGNYVVFLDGDDYLSENTFEILSRVIIEKNDPDMIEYGSTPFPKSPAASKWLYDILTTPDDFYYKIDQTTFLKTGFLKVFCWRYCIRSQFIKERHITFPTELIFGEDAIFVMHCLMQATGVVIISDKLYFYRHNRSDSFSTTIYKDSELYAKLQFMILERMLKDAFSLFEFEKSPSLFEYCSYFIEGCLNGLSRSSKVNYITKFLSLMKEYGLDQCVYNCSQNRQNFYNHCLETVKEESREKEAKAVAVTVVLVDKNICTGCGACYNICPVNAIRMESDSEGFLCPVIKDDICTSCGLCYNKCPAVNEDIYFNNAQPEVYAAYAPDEIRMESSSGGMFTVLAEHIIDKGGYVAGVRWDEKFSAVFDIVEKKEDLALMRGSKYVQSSTGLIFRKIKQLLNDGKTVLFTGVPCQTAGLRHFLGKDYDNLYIVDILCHGSPSPKSFEEFLKCAVNSIEGNDDISQIESIEFRNKHRHGWGHSIIIKLKNGMEYDKTRNATNWYNSFLNILNCRRVCGQCRYNTLPRQGDITLGDFWGIESVMPDSNYHKGVSVVTLNNEKGQRLFGEISDKLEFKRQSNIDDAKKGNWNLVGSSRAHKFRNDFFRLLNMYGNFEKATEYALNRKFDIGFIGWWYGENYGSILTSFALHQYLKSRNKRVLMIEWPLRSKDVHVNKNTISRRLASRYYEVSIDRTFDELHDLNWFCDAFVLGSDQLWNYWSSREVDYFYFLDFAEDAKKKIAYSTSFGHREFEAPTWYLKAASYHMSRFDHISVRENEGVELCRNVFGVDAVRNIDPVFICDKQEYLSLAEQSKLDTGEKYIFAYVLNPTPEKRQALIELSQKSGLGIRLVLDRQFDSQTNRSIMDMDNNIIVPQEIEDWLKLIINADYVFTDSYHGTCFSLIFNKQFSCIGNMLRGVFRFTTLLDCAGLSDRLLFDPLKVIDQYEQVINYDEVNARLNNDIERSRRWLNNALDSPKFLRSSGYDLLIDKIRELQKQIDELKRK